VSKGRRAAVDTGTMSIIASGVTKATNEKKLVEPILATRNAQLLKFALTGPIISTRWQ
jgi:hypothetical protein